MDAWVLPLLLLVLSIALLGVLGVLRTSWQQARRAPPPPPPRRPRRREHTVIDLEAHTTGGTTVADDPARRPRPHPATTQLRAPRRLTRPLLGGLLLGGLLLAAGVWLLPRLWQPAFASEQFVIAVAPFDDGGNGETGAAVARDLVRVLQRTSGERLAVRLLERPPINATAAITLSRQQQADVLLWGTVRPGALLNTASLSPRLTYSPSGPYAPHAWPGYTSRFALQGTYELAREPLNGEAVLPRLLLALADYSAGQADVAYGELGRLEETYPLHPALPEALRGTVLWARGSYDEAAATYRAALAQPLAPPVQARLLTNLGAVLLDARSAETRDTLLQASALLTDTQLGALHMNLGLLEHLEGNAAAAIPAFVQARAAFPNSLPVLLALTHAYRDTGQLAAAAATLQTANARVDEAGEQVPPALRPLHASYWRANLSEEQGLLTLAEFLDAHGPLLWQVEASTLPLAANLEPALAALRSALAQSDALLLRWQQRATADDVTGAMTAERPAPRTGLIAAQQAERIARQRERQRYHLALALVEVAHLQGRAPGGVLTGLWASLTGNVPRSEARTILDDLTVDTAADLPYLITYARLLRAPPLETAQIIEAEQRYDQIISIAPTRPEGYAGKALLALERGETTTAFALFLQALAQEPRYYPARLHVAAMAEQSGDWTTALAHLRTLAEHDPTPAAQIRLAAALRRSGPDNFAAAEAALAALVARQQPVALLELGRLEVARADLDAAAAAFEAAYTSEASPPAAALELGRTRLAQGTLAAAEAPLLAAIASNDTATRTRAHLAAARLYALGLPETGPDLHAVRSHVHDAAQTTSHDPALLREVGTALLDYDQPAAAQDVLARAATLQPDDAPTLVAQAQAALALAQPMEARTLARRALDLTSDLGEAVYPLRAAALIALAAAEQQTGALDSAANLYTQAQTLDSASHRALIGRGRIEAARGTWTTAAALFEQALTLPAAQDDAVAHFWLAEGLLRLGDLPRAQAHYTQALALRPVFPEALHGRAQALRQRGDPAAALQAVDQALAQRPAYANGLLLRGALHQQAGRFAAARDDYSAALALDSQLALAYYERGRLAIQEEAYEDAVSDLERAVALTPDDGAAFYWLGRAYVALDRPAPALQALQQAVALSGTQNPEARYYQGVVEAQLGRTAEAAASFQTVIATATDAPLVARARTALERMNP